MMAQRDAADVDPVLEAEVERALLPYRALLPPELFEEMRRLLRLGATHPYAAQLLRQVRPAPQVEESGEVGIGSELVRPSSVPPLSGPVSSGLRRRGGGR